MTVRIELRLKELLDERGITQKKLAEMTGIRPAAISNLSRGFIERINIDHLERIAECLNIRDMNKLVAIVDVNENKEQDTIKDIFNFEGEPKPVLYVKFPKAELEK